MILELVCSETGSIVHCWAAPQVHASRPVNAVVICGTTVKRGWVLSVGDVRGGDYKRCDDCHGRSQSARAKLDLAFPAEAVQ